MPTIADYNDKMDKLKEEIEIESEKVLKVINLKKLLSLDKEGKIKYVKNILFQFWESQEKRIKKSYKMGEKKAKDLLRQI